MNDDSYCNYNDFSVHYAAINPPNWRSATEAKPGTRYIVRGRLVSQTFGVLPMHVTNLGVLKPSGDWELELPVPMFGNFECTGIQDWPSYD